MHIRTSPTPHRCAAERSWPRLLVLAFMVFQACSAPSPLVLGIVLDEDGMRGATVAVEEINARGGIDGRPLKLRRIGGAGSTKAKVALEAAALLAADPQVLAVIGHTNSSASLAASQVYNTQHVVQIAPTSTTPLYSQAGPWSFRMVGSDIHQAEFLASHLLAMTPRPRVAVLFVNDDYGRPLRDIVESRLRAGGLSPVYSSPYSESATQADHAEMIDALSRSHPQVLLWLGRATEFAKVQAAMRKALPHIDVLASDGFSGSIVVHDSLHLLSGVSYVRLTNPLRSDSAVGRLYARYEKAGWVAPSDQAVLSYDAVLVIAEAIRAAGPERERIRDWLLHFGNDVPPVHGLSGEIAFTADGDRRAQYFLETIGSAPVDAVQHGH